MTTPHNKTALTVSLAYIVLIFGLWIVYVSLVYPLVARNPNLWARIVCNESIRVVIFVVPILLYCKFFAGENLFQFLKLNVNVARGIFWGIIAAVGYAILTMARVALLTEGGMNPKPIPVEAWFTSLTVATMIEEIAFRGFLLQQFERVINFWAANLISACLFAAIHFPGWIIVGGSMLVPDKLLPTAEILFLGLLLGYLFKRTGSLWSCIVLHSANNLIATVFFS